VCVCVCALNISHGGLNVRLFADYLSTLDIVHDVDWRPFGIVVRDAGTRIGFAIRPSHIFPNV
jgi:hypothetical protein